MRTLILIVLGVAIVGVGACSNDPIALTPTAGSPCGQAWHSCGDGFCCGQGFTCGGAFPAVGCPADSCCFIETDEIGKRRNEKKRPAVRP